MSAQVFKLKSSSIFLSILLLCLFFTVVSVRGMGHRFASAVEQEPEIHEAEAVHVEEVHEEAEHETIGHVEAEHEVEEGEGIVIPPIVDAAFPVVIVALLLAAGKILEGYGKKTA